MPVAKAVDRRPPSSEINSSARWTRAIAIIWRSILIFCHGSCRPPFLSPADKARRSRSAHSKAARRSNGASATDFLRSSALIQAAVASSVPTRYSAKQGMGITILPFFAATDLSNSSSRAISSDLDWAAHLTRQLASSATIIYSSDSLPYLVRILGRGPPVARYRRQFQKCLMSIALIQIFKAITI